MYQPYIELMNVLELKLNQKAKQIHVYKPVMYGAYSIIFNVLINAFSLKFDRLLEVIMYHSSYSDLLMNLSLLCLILQGVALLSLKHLWLTRIHRYVDGWETQELWSGQLAVLKSYTVAIYKCEHYHAIITYILTLVHELHSSIYNISYRALNSCEVDNSIVYILQPIAN